MLDKKSAVPLYVQARETLLERIVSGGYHVDTKIPSENELCKEFGISRMTIRQVISWLVRDGYLYTIPGKGTYVAQPKLTSERLSGASIREQLREYERGIIDETLEVILLPCPQSEMSVLNLGSDDNIYRIESLGRMGEIPLRVDVSIIPQKYCSSLSIEELRSEKVDDILKRKYGIMRARIEEIVEAVSATKEDAEALCVKKGSPLLKCQTLYFDKNENIYKCMTALYLGEKVKLKFY